MSIRMLLEDNIDFSQWRPPAEPTQPGPNAAQVPEAEVDWASVDDRSEVPSSEV